MEFVTPIITSVVQSLMDPVKKHLGFLVSSTKYVNQMDAKMKQLQDKAEEVQATWDRAIGNTEVIPVGVEPWLKDVKKLNDRNDNLNKAIRCFNISKRYKAGKQSFDILEEIKELEIRGSEIKFTHVKIPLAEVGFASTLSSTSPSVPMSTEIDFESRELIFNNALQALQSNDESQKMIALCGAGGVGKTTMMEQLKKFVEDSNMFNLIVKVVIGENNDAISFQQAIAQYVGNVLTEQTKDARADRLRKDFEAKSQQGKKILVIMDDLWSEVDLKDVGLSPLPHGFKMLLTSRFENVCAEMGVHLILRMGVLSKIEAKTLFSKTVRPSPWDDDDTELQKIGEEIVMKCGGLPIAIVTIAKILSGNIKDAWKKALWRLEKDDLKDLDRITHRIFEMSYEYLKEDGDKAIFLLCGLFPDDFDICTEDLLRYGWGLSFFKDVETLAIARHHMNVCVNNLIRANLLTKSDVSGCVKMHDLVRAFVLSNLSEVKQASIVSHENMSVHMLRKDTKKSYERILLKCNDICEIPRVFNYSNLSLLIIMDGKQLKFSKEVYERMEKLKVMSYEKLGIPLLPIMFEHSTKLRTICLHSCVFMDSDISFLGSIHNMEILSLVDCNIRRLPSTIGNLKKLKLLDLNGCVDLHIDDGVIQNLESLEELHMRALNYRFVRFTQANCDELQEISRRLFVLELEFIARNPQKHSVSRQDMPQLKNMSFQNLERFNISIGCPLEKEHSEEYSLKNKLNLVATCTELHECNISDLFEGAEQLNLEVNDMNNLEEISLQHTFCQLRVFHVSNCANLTCLFTPNVTSGLKKLERLTVSNCPLLEEMVSKINGVGVITFKKLNFMSLKDLPKLVTLSEDAIELPELLELKLRGLPNFTSIYHDNTCDMPMMKPLLNIEVLMPKLEKLDISMMKKLLQIWPCEISTSEKNNVSMLRQIKVNECDSLINIFPLNPLPLLNHLEELEVERCGSIEVLFNVDFECVSGMGEHNSRLRSIEVKYVEKINALWRMTGVNNSDTVINCFKGVEKIDIQNCPKFTNIFTPTTANFDLGALTFYKTRTTGCDLLVNRKTEINMTYPSYLLHTCHHLQHLELEDDKRVKEVVFEMDSHQPLLLPYLEDLVLNDLKETSHVWKYNWNKFLILHHPPLQLPFQNLTIIILRKCPKIKYLFSPLMARYLPNLKQIGIYGCKGIEKVISSRDDENISTYASSHVNTTFFPNLETLELRFLPSLKSIDGGDQHSDIANTIHGPIGQVIGACWLLCQYPTRIFIHYCNALSNLVPWYSVGQMKRLEVLYIGNCKTMTQVFESETRGNNIDEGSTNLGTTLVVPQLSNLTSVGIYGCELLSHVFTFSTLESLKQLKELGVTKCKSMQVIVKEENIIKENVVVFPRLQKLELDDLPNLKGFFLGKNIEFRWPLLDDVMINDCPQLMVFTSGYSKIPKLKCIRTSFEKYSVEGTGLNFPGMINQTTFPTCSSLDLTVSKGMPWSSYHNLIEINIKPYSYDGRIIIPSNVQPQLEKLEKIHVESSHGVEEVFEWSGFNESQPTAVVKIPNLTEVILSEVYNLKYLWKSNRSMVLEFPNLTTLYIFRCESLKHVFTCSMIGSLVQLQELQILWCIGIEVIVKQEEECDIAKVYELPRLKSLKLDLLPRLKGFCLEKDAFSCPTLDTLTINECKSITVFTKGDLSAPNLKFINSSFGTYTINHGDLNSFIMTNQEKFKKECT